MVTVAQCQRLQTAWSTALASATGGKTFSTHGTTWVWLPARRELMMMFPESVSAPAVRPAMAEGARLGASSVRVWLNNAVDGSELGPLGFSPSWQPWWMTAPVASVVGEHDDAAALVSEVPDYSGPLAQELRVARLQPPQAWHAVTRHNRSGDISGAVYSFYPSGVSGLHDLGGIFNLEVLPPCRRRGLGTALLSTAARAAGGAGAASLSVNATPLGYPFFLQRGFALQGRGKTYTLKL